MEPLRDSKSAINLNYLMKGANLFVALDVLDRKFDQFPDNTGVILRG